MPPVLTARAVADFRHRLCGVAEQLFAAHGPDGVTIRQLAAELRVSPMTPYRYFKDKDDILAAVRASAFDRFAVALEAASAGGGDPLSVSRAVSAAYVSFAFDHPAAYRLMFDLAQPTEADYPALVTAAARARTTLTAHIQALKDTGLIDGDTETIGHMFWALLHGTIVLQMAGKLSPRIDPATLRRAAMAALARGLGLPAG